jgi:glutaredoxin
LLTQVLLYSTSGCHLCDEALDVLTPVCHEFGLEVMQVDICTNEKLEQLYETRIPVISLHQHELDWPFTAAEARNFLLQQKL